MTPNSIQEKTGYKLFVMMEEMISGYIKILIIQPMTILNRLAVQT